MNQVTNVQIYNSVGECLEACDAAHKAGRRYRGLERERGRSGWVGRAFDGWEHARRAASEYWEEGLEIVQSMLYDIDRKGHTLPPPVDRRRRRVFADDGDDLDLGRLRDGRQEFWLKTRRISTRAPAPVTLVTDLLTACSHRPQDILWRGACAVVVCDLLEKAGYRVDLWTATCNDPHGGRHARDYTFWAVRLKDMSTPVDISNVVNGVSGWFFRTVWFQSMNVPVDRTPDCGYGSGVVPWLTKFPDMVHKLTVPNARVVTVDNVWSLDAALRKVTETINDLNKEDLQCRSTC